MGMIVIGESGKRKVRLDLDLLLRTRLLVQANSGGGKSWLLRRLAEQLFGKVQVIILDREGEFATLREKFGFVLVGKGGETPADSRSAAMVAHKLLELKASAVCDLYEMKDSERHRWVRLFLEALIDSPKSLWHPTVIIIDEIHSFCPEKGESEAADAVIGLATRGRKRGFCLVGATQRLGKFKKDAAAELLNVFIGQTFIDIDQRRASDALGVPRSEERKFFNDLKFLEQGDFYALGRAVTKERVLLHVGPVETTHPEMGSSKHAAEPPPAPDKIRALLPRLADLPKAAEEKAKNEADLRAEIRSLKAQLSGRPKETAQIEKKIEKRVEVAVVKDAQIKRLEKVVERLKEQGRLADETARVIAALFTKTPRPSPYRYVKKETPRMSVPTRVPAPERVVSGGNGVLDKAQRKVLTVLAQYPDGCEIGKIALLSGYRISGGFKNTLAALRTAGYMEGSNGGVMRITGHGSGALGDYAPLPEGRDLANYWLNHSSLGSCERKVLRVLLENPEGMTGPELAEASGYAWSGGFKNALSSLRTAGVIVGRNNEIIMPHEDLS